jgi:hypothetical protein
MEFEPSFPVGAPKKFLKELFGGSSVVVLKCRENALLLAYHPIANPMR